MAIDVLAKVRTSRKGAQSVYEADYEVGERLKTVAAQHPNVAFVVVHHTSKRYDDALDAVSGSYGLAGGVDNVLVMLAGDTGNMDLHINGRDIEQNDTITLTKGDTGMWTLDSREKAATASLSDTRAQILEAIRGGAVTPLDIRGATGLSEYVVTAQLRRMKVHGDIILVSRGRYTIPAQASERSEISPPPPPPPVISSLL